ncbi:MAG: saccharopine dehydrogenase family protein, partial [Bacteroidales bacterium]
MNNKYVVLGAGRQGVAAAYDLGRFGDAGDILLCDIDSEIAKAGADRLNALLGRPVARARQLDVSNLADVAAVLDRATACISSVHYVHNLETTRIAIEKKVHLTDFGGNTDVVWQQRGLDEQARRAGVSVVPDCGMGPGLNVSLGTYVMSLVEVPREVLIWDGGLPQNPEPPFNYASTFALGGLTNEYDGSATFLRDGKMTAVPCFSGLETLEFPAPTGQLEAFVTSGGLSTSPWTFKDTLLRLENKTLRYPGHCAQFKAFSDLGLLGLEGIELAPGGPTVVPRDLFHALLGPHIVRDEIRDICVMRVTCKGETKGQPASATVELVDRYDEATCFTAMQRLTGWHASIMLIAAVKGETARGVVPVELALSGRRIVEESRRR